MDNIKQRQKQVFAQRKPPRAGCCSKIFTCWRIVYALIVFVLVPLLWMGAQVGREDRLLAIQRVIPSTLASPKTDTFVAHIGEVLDATYEAVEGTKVAVFLWGKVGLLTGGPLFTGSIYLLLTVGDFFSFLWPYFEIGGAKLVEFGVWVQPYFLVFLEHAAQVVLILWAKFLEQDSMNIFLEVMTPVLAFSLWMLKNWIIKERYIEKLQIFSAKIKHKIKIRYQQLLAYVKKRSLVVASFVPHLLLLIPIGATIYFLPDLLVAISRGYILLLVSMIYPIWHSISSLETADKEQKRKAITYWIVFSIPSFISAFIEYLPFGAKLVSMVPYTQEIFFVFCLWMQLPWTDGSTIMYTLIVPLVNKFVSIIPLPGFLKTVPESEEKKKFILFTIISAFLPEQYKDKASSILFHSGHLLFGFMFFFTPNYFTGIGCLLMGMAVPYYSSITALVNTSRNIKGSAVNNSEEDLSWWLRYWIVFYSFSSVHDGLTAAVGLEHFPFWYHIKLGIIMWLELPIFQGANMIYSYVFLPPYSTLSQIFETASSSSLKDFMSPKLFGKVASRIQVDSEKKDEKEEDEEKKEKQEDEDEEEKKKEQEKEKEKEKGKEREEKLKEEVDGNRPVAVGKLKRDLFKTWEGDRTKLHRTSSTSSSNDDF